LGSGCIGLAKYEGVVGVAEVVRSRAGVLVGDEPLALLRDGVHPPELWELLKLTDESARGALIVRSRLPVFCGEGGRSSTF